MSVMAVAVGGVALAGAYGAYTSGKAADKATAAQERIAGDQTALSKESLDWSKQVYADGKPARDAAEKRSQEVSDAALTGMKNAEARAADLETYNKETYRPLEQGIVSDAQAYDTPMRRLAAGESAMAGVDSSAQKIQQAQARELGRAGIAPGSTKALALAEDSAVAQSKVRAAAGTTAVNNVEQQGLARKMDAASLGRNIQSAQATQQQIATQSGQTSAGSGMQALVAQQSGTGVVQSGFNTAMNGNASAGGMYAGIASRYDKQAAASAQQVGDAINFGVSQGIIKSDEAVKSGTGNPANTKKALDEIVKTPVDEGWTYDPAKGGPDDGGQPHIGPMAQDVNRVSGEAAAPGGKEISIVNELGRMRAAIQELEKRQAKSTKTKKVKVTA